MDNRTNTIAGWVLGAGIVALGASIVTGEVFKGERPETMGYPIEGVELESGGAEAEQPIAFFLATADVGRGEASFKKCAACHTITQGGATGLGPNLWSNLGAPIAHVAGFAYSDALKNHGGNWGWDNMSEWLKSPRSFAPGTKMTFAGLSNPQERADLLAYMNTMTASPIPVPPPPVADAPVADEGAAEAPADGNAIITEADAAKQPEGNVGGPGAPTVAGRAGQEKGE